MIYNTALDYVRFEVAVYWIDMLNRYFMISLVGCSLAHVIHT